MLVQISKEDINVIFSMIDKYNIDDEEMDAIERLEFFGNEREDWEEIRTLEQIRKLEKLEDLLYEALQTYIKKNIDYGDSFRKSYIDLGNYAFMTALELEEDEDLISFDNYYTAFESEEDDVEDIPLAMDKDGEPIVPKEIKPGLKTGRYRGYQIYIKYDKGFLISRLPNGFYCGYVVVPLSHPFYGKDWLELDDIDVHGGISFSGFLSSIGHGQYLLGFDCGHHGDNALIQNEEYTLKECMKLVDQLIEVDVKKYTEGDKLNI